MNRIVLNDSWFGFGLFQSYCFLNEVPRAKAGADVLDLFCTMLFSCFQEWFNIVCHSSFQLFRLTRRVLSR